jgi:hypothetical protein
MSTYTDYTAYFQKLAETYLNHSTNEKHFFRKGLEEFLNGLSTNVNYPAMLLGKYDYKYTDNGADNIMKPRTVAFIICDHVADMEDYDSIDKAMDSTELIVDKIYNQIRKDIRPPYTDPNFEFAKLGEVQVTPVSNYADGAHGWFVTIEIYSHHDARVV